MTVAELIGILAILPPTAEVVFHDEEMAVYEAGSSANTVGAMLAQIDENGRD